MSKAADATTGIVLGVGILAIGLIAFYAIATRAINKKAGSISGSYTQDGFQVHNAEGVPMPSFVQ